MVVTTTLASLPLAAVVADAPNKWFIGSDCRYMAGKQYMIAAFSDPAQTEVK